MAIRDSSRRWRARQERDIYVRRARAQGYRSRAAYKLAAIDRRHSLFQKGQRIVDLGAAPGSWSQYVAHVAHVAHIAHIAQREGIGQIVAVDIMAIEPIAHVERIQADILSPRLAAEIRQILRSSADIVLSDLAPPTTGHRATDQARAENLALVALELTRQILARGGDFLVKTRQGGTDELAAQLKRDFAKLIFVKPDASRGSSAEIYLLARGHQRGG